LIRIGDGFLRQSNNFSFCSPGILVWTYVLLALTFVLRGFFIPPAERKVTVYLMRQEAVLSR
jgi:hypothetical protein